MCTWDQHSAPASQSTWLVSENGGDAVGPADRFPRGPLEIYFIAHTG